jgi:PAS domain S-box-containing protein
MFVIAQAAEFPSYRFLTKNFNGLPMVHTASPRTDCCALCSEEAVPLNHISVEQTYDYDVMVLSVVFAIAAVYATVHLTGSASGPRTWRRIAWLAALAALFGGALRAAHDFGVPVFRSQILYHYSTVLLVTLAAVVSSTLAIRTVKGEHAARANAARFETLAEAIPQIIWIADASGNTTYINKRWFEMTGTTEQDAGNGEWAREVHPDDRDPLIQKWQQCVRSGETFEVEYRLHDAASGYRWYLDRAVPLRDDHGVIQQWFGTCTDIEGQKHYQQILEQQIKERTEELADTNTRLQQEMWEKDFARRELDEHNEGMMQALKERSHRATLLAKMGELLQSCHTREEVFTAALGFAPRIFPSRRGAVALFNPSHNLVEVAGQWHDCELPVPSFEAESCWALRTGHPHLVLAGDTTAACVHAPGVKNTYLCVPILAQGEALGILHIQATDQDPNLGEAEMSFKTTFAAQVGLSVANIRLREALRAQSTKDPLTGLYNRRYLQEMLDREIRRAIRSEQPMGILMLDLDHFKKFNDTYGHEAGDAVLRETAALLSRSIRAEDFVCRFGGRGVRCGTAHSGSACHVSPR